MSSWDSLLRSCPAAKRSGSSWQRSCPDGAPEGRSIFWTNPRPDCICRRAEADRDSASACRGWKYRCGNRAQSGCHQDGGLSDRYRTRGRHARRNGHRKGNAGGGCEESCIVYRILCKEDAEKLNFSESPFQYRGFTL